MLRYASVLGVAFTEGQLRSMLEGETVPTGRATMRRLAYFLEPEGHGRYRFQHELIRDAAYEGLPFRRRRALHARVGATVEGAAPDPDEQSALLSLHFYEAGSLDKAWHYSRVAGDRAASKYAYVEASEFFRRAVSAARGVTGLGPPDLGDVYEALGDAQRRIGALPAAKDGLPRGSTWGGGRPAAGHRPDAQGGHRRPGPRSHPGGLAHAHPRDAPARRCRRAVGGGPPRQPRGRLRRVPERAGPLSGGHPMGPPRRSPTPRPRRTSGRSPRRTRPCRWRTRWPGSPATGRTGRWPSRSSRSWGSCRRRLEH